MPAPFDVVVLGDYCLDLIFTGLPGFPQLGAEVVSAGFHMEPGGAFNSAAAMHRLGLRVGWAADFGDDDFSRFVLARAQAEGLEPALFLYHPEPLRSITVALSYPQDRAFIGYYDPELAAPAALAAAREAATRALYLAHFHREGPVLEAALARASGEGLALLMDGNTTDLALNLRQPGARRALGSLKVFLPNATEARRLTGQTDLDGRCASWLTSARWW
jgi:sugar/nucleoside kinase (ribokinase family)